MATISIGEAMSLIDGILDKTAKEAETFMKSYIDEHADKGYKTGALVNSIYNEARGTRARAIGSRLHHAQFVDQGRREITKAPGYMQYYDTKLKRWVKTHHVNKMDGIHFIDETAKHIENTGIKL